MHMHGCMHACMHTCVCACMRACVTGANMKEVIVAQSGATL